MLEPWDSSKKNANFVDISHWDLGLNMQALKDGGVDMVVIKWDEMAETFISEAEAVGMPWSIYDWVFPTQDGKQQALDLITFLAKHPLCVSVWGDHEQEYLYYAEYLAYLKGKIPWSQVKKVPAAEIRSVGMAYQNTLNEWGMDNHVVTGMYDRWEYLRRIYAKDFDWVVSNHHWSAHYIYYPANYVHLSWDQLWSKAPRNSFEKDLWLAQPLKDRIRFPQSTFTWSSPIGRQWTGDKVYVPGMKVPVDANQFRGTREEMFSFFGKSPIPPRVDLPYAKRYLRDGVPALNIRPGPADFSRSLGHVLADQVIKLKQKDPVRVEDGGLWRELWDQPGWINQGYLK